MLGFYLIGRKQLTRACRWLMLLFILGVTPAYAVLTDSLTIGNAKALSLGNAVTADPPGIDSINFNPAGLAQLKGRQVYLKTVAATFGIDLAFGDYNADRKNYLAQKQALGIFPDSYFYDEAHFSESKTQGATLMLPVFGMTDIPVMLGPMGGASYNPPGSKITFATNVYAPMMVGFNRADNDPGRWMGKRLAFSLLTYFSPSFAYQLNDEFSFGASLTFNYAGIGIELPFRSPHIGIEFLGELQNSICPGGIIPICGGELGLYSRLGTLKFEVEDPMTLGFNLGLLWNPTPWLKLGMTYQSPVPMKMHGDFTWDNSPSWVSFVSDLANSPGYAPIASLVSIFGWSLPEGQTQVKGKAKLNMEMPEHFAVGLSLQLTPDIKLDADCKYTNWAVWNSIPVQFSQSIDFLRLAQIAQPDLVGRGGTGLTFPLGMKDTWNGAVGIEYRWNDNIVLRAGVEDRPSSISAAHDSPLLPIGDGYLYGTGMGLKLSSGAKLDFALGYFSTSVNMPGGTSDLGNSTNPLLVIYNPYAGTDIKSKMTAILFEFSYAQTF